MKDNIDEDKKMSVSRRKMMRSGTAIGTAAVVPGMASADRSDKEAVRSAKEKDISSELLAEEDDHKIYKIENEDRVSAAKVYTDGPKEGKVEHVNLIDGTSSESSKKKAGSETIRKADKESAKEISKAALASDGIEIVKRSKNINRDLDECSQDFCDGFTYTHVQTGFSVEFVNQLNSLGQSVIEEALVVLIEMYTYSKWGKWMTGIVGVIVSTLLSIANGSKVTVSPWDRDEGWTSYTTDPVIEVGVAEGWDVHAHDLVNVQDNTNEHIGYLDYRCG